MDTKPMGNKPEEPGKKKNWTKASIAAAVAAGVLTAEAANLLYAELAKENGKTEPAAETETTTPAAETNPTPNPELETESQAAVDETEEVEVILEEPELETETVVVEDIDGPGALPDPEPYVNDEDLVDYIVEEIDPEDIDMEDVLLVDEVGTLYTEEGDEINAAVIHDSNGNQAIMVDVDGDHVYDVIATPEGEVIAQVQGDIDVSDAELLYAQQHGETGYMEQNDYDIAMNEENEDIQDDIHLT